MKVDIIMETKKKWRSNKLPSESTSGVDKKIWEYCSVEPMTSNEWKRNVKNYASLLFHEYFKKEYIIYYPCNNQLANIMGLFRKQILNSNISILVYFKKLNTFFYKQIFS